VGAQPPAISGPADGIAGAIDRNSPVPYYDQLKELLREEIARGH